MPRPGLRIGLTGGIASGKSVVTDMFAALGAAVIDTDVIAREVVQPGEPALDEIREAFGARVLRPDGHLDRAGLRAVVFADADARRRLEAILHPRIRDRAFDQAAAARGPYALIVVPLLAEAPAESPFREAMDRIVVVDVPVGLQLERLLRRDAENELQARRMIAAQASRSQRLALADDIIDNSGSLAATRRRVEKLHRGYVELAAARNA